MIKVLLWDIDGTLLSFEKSERASLKECFQELDLGELTDEMIGEYIKINARYWQALERGEMTKPQILVARYVDFLGLYGLDTSKAAKLNEMYQNKLGIHVFYNEYAEEVVDSLKGKVLQCAVTNGTKVAQDGKLAKSGLDKKLDYLFISEVMGVDKPNIAFFDQVFETLEKAGIQAEKDEMLIVGDSLTSDMQGGVNAKIKTCWFNPEGKENTKGLPLDYEIKSLSEIYDLLG